MSVVIPFSSNNSSLTVEGSYDLDFPLEVDDEYWEPQDAALAFCQPQGKPSLISALNSMLKLLDILSFTLRTIVCVLCFILQFV